MADKKSVDSVEDESSVLGVFGSKVDFVSLAQRFGVAAAFGGIAGYAAKKTLKLTALTCGICFIALQTLSYAGYIDVKWGKIEREIQRQADLNNDGKVDTEDIQLMKKKLFNVLTYGIPNAGGFAGGFLWAFKKL